MPILFLHGTKDTRARLEEARQVYEAVPGAKWFKEFPGVGHAASVVPYRKMWTETVRQFLHDAHI
jgi:pimeloyl-ACP methyl ester carboxylesterase